MPLWAPHVHFTFFWNLTPGSNVILIRCSATLIILSLAPYSIIYHQRLKMGCGASTVSPTPQPVARVASVAAVPSSKLGGDSGSRASDAGQGQSLRTSARAQVLFDRRSSAVTAGRRSSSSMDAAAADDAAGAAADADGSLPSLGTAPSALRIKSRAPKSDDSSTVNVAFGGKMAGRRRSIFSNLTLPEIASMSHAQVSDIWLQLDDDRSGILEKREMKVLATDVAVAVYKHLEQAVRKQMPNASDDELAKVVMRDMVMALPIASKGEDPVKDYAKYLAQQLDIDGDGKLTKLEFQTRWMVVAKEIYNIAHDGSDKGSGGCSIS